jgi:hypothetical protein
MESDPRTMEETVQEAAAIFLGTVIKQQPHYGDDAKRFIFTEYTFKVDEAILADVPVAKGNEIKLTFRGGTVGAETQDIAGMPALSVGARYLLMLRPQWAKIKGIPSVGADHGLFRVMTDSKTKTERIFDAHGAPVVLIGDRGLVPSTDPSAGKRPEDSMPLGAFLERLRSELQRIKQAPLPERPQSNRANPGALKTFSRPDDPEVRPYRGRIESKEPQGEAPTPGPRPPQNHRPEAVGTGEAISRDPHRSEVAPRFATDGVANLPIVVNQFPSSFTPWSPEDEFQMASWNHYASDVFRVFVTPTETWSYGNGVFDLAGWPDSETMRRQFGVTWEDLGNPRGTTFRRFNGGTIIEADIALNPGLPWTLDDEGVHDGSGLRPFRRTMAHELGHVWGLAHQFDFLSIMNYPPARYRPFCLPFMDDAEGIRQRYPARRVETTDLGIYLFRSAGSQNWQQADFPASVRIGSNFEVTNYHLENVGTRRVTTPTVEWYLTSVRNFNGTTFFLGTTTYPTLEPFAYFDPPSAARTLRVPAGVPAGSYFLAAFIRGDESMGTNNFQTNNSRSFSRTKIAVLS